MAQIANARETFSDLESAYRKFKLELDGVKEEHRHEVRWNSYLTSMIVSDLVPASQDSWIDLHKDAPEIKVYIRWTYCAY